MISHRITSGASYLSTENKSKLPLAAVHSFSKDYQVQFSEYFCINLLYIILVTVILILKNYNTTE